MSVRHLLLLSLMAVSSYGQIVIPGNSINVPAINAGGVSFTYTGTLTQASTIQFVQTQNPCLQYSQALYCVNGAGVIISGGTVGTSSGFSGTMLGTSGSWTYGALVMNISGVGTVQVFPVNAGNGSGSATPPANLTLPATSLSALGFGSFSVNNPTITFAVADSDHSDNTGQFVVSQTNNPPGVPLPSSLLLMLTGLTVLGALYFGRKLHASRAV